MSLKDIFNILSDADAILYVVNKISDVTQIVELLNDRGRKLTKLEGVKSFFMYRIGCLSLKDNGEQSIDDIQSEFSIIYRNIEKHSLDGNDVLRYHTIAFENSKVNDYDSSDKFIKNNVNTLLEKKVADAEVKDEIIDYVNRLKDSFVLFSKIRENKLGVDAIDQLLMIGRISPFYPLLMYIYQYNCKKFSDFTYDLVKFTFKTALIGLRNKNENLYRYIRNGNGFSDLFSEIYDENRWNINGRVY